MIRIPAAMAISLLVGPLSICSAQSALEVAPRGGDAGLSAATAQPKKCQNAARPAPGGGAG
ncbi:MAG: hypothetical protein VYD05_02205, partial [Planctomycetota bacterium]|nr:hypothetical protein [Planctomycetota bacterium]